MKITTMNNLLVLTLSLGILVPAYAKKNPKVVEDKHLVKLKYTGKLPDGRVFDSSTTRGPLEFQVGDGKILPDLEKAVLGMKKGEQKSVTIPPENAFGEFQVGKILEVPKSMLTEEVEASLKEGSLLNMNTFLGQAMLVRVVKIKDDTIFVDANHMLAGKTIVFDVELLSIENPEINP